MTVHPIRFGWLLVSAALFALIAYSFQRTQFSGLLGLYFLAVWGYSIRIRSLQTQSSAAAPDKVLLGAAVLFRVLLLLAPSNLSDDYARFIWDGRLLVHGYNPYLYLPRSLLGTQIAQAANLTPALFSQLNSPDYFTVYPPLNQVFFGLAAWLGGNNILSTVIWLRVPILLAEIGTIYMLPRLLQRIGQNPNLSLVYALNPLVILELTGNIHFEAVVIFFCLLAIWCLVKPIAYKDEEMTSLGSECPTRRPFKEMTSLAAPSPYPVKTILISAGLFALGVTTKMLPLIALPLLIRYLGWRQGVIYSAIVGLITITFFLPFASVELIQNVSSSINLYFQKFEFNASIYYLVREIGYWLQGYNVIRTVGPWLSFVTIAGIVWLAFGRFRMPLSTRLLFTLTLYFAMATTVHPWYITLVVAASVFTSFRYPLVWSALVWTSYATYQYEPYHEYLWLTAAEYLAVLLVGLLEWRHHKQQPQIEEPAWHNTLSN